MIALGILFALVALLSWGVSDFFASIAVKKLDAIRTFFWMQFSGIIIMLLYIPVLKEIPRLNLELLALLVITGGLLAFATVMFFKGLSVGKVSIISPISAGWSMITVLLSLIFLDERLTLIQILGVVLVIIGTVISSFKYHDIIKLNLKKAVQGVKYGLAALVGWGLMAFMISLAVNEIGWFFPILYTNVIAFICIIAYFIFKNQKISMIDSKNIFPVAMVGITSAAGFIFYGLGVNTDYTSIVAPVSASYPVVTVILAGIFSKEKLDLNQYIGILGIIGGIILLSL